MLWPVEYLSPGPGSADHPSPAQVDAWQRRSGPPENEVPSPVPAAAILGRTDDVAVALLGMVAYSTGVGFTLAVRMRVEPRSHRTYELISGHAYGDDEASPDRLLLGVEYADGRTATNLGGPWPPGSEWDDADVSQPVLSPSSGGGGGRSYDQTYFLSPLPPPGPLTVVCTWAAFDVPESRAVLDGESIATAGSRAVVLWPWEPEQPGAHEPPEPRVPAAGWFADAVRRRLTRPARPGE